MNHSVLWIIILCVNGAVLGNDFVLLQETFFKAVRDQTNLWDNGTQLNETELVTPRLEDDDLYTLLEKLFAKIKVLLKGNDPFETAGGSINYDKYSIDFEGSAQSVIISGQSSMVLENLKVEQAEQLEIEIDLSFSNLQIVGEYDLLLNLLSMQKLFGNGRFGLQIPVVLLNITIGLKENSKTSTLRATKLDIYYSVPNIVIDFKNLLERPPLSDVVNTMINALLPDVLQTRTSILTVLSDLAKRKLNNYLNAENITLAEIINVIQHFIL